MRRAIGWIALAALGLAVTAALAVATSHLTVERVGLAGESPSAAAAHLAPAPRDGASPHHHEPETVIRPGPGGEGHDGDGDSDD